MIAFRGFTKRFGSHVAVEDLTLNVAPGEVVALLGPNGSGKTTSLKAAAGLIAPTAGTVLIGTALKPALEADARVATAFMPQHVSFPSYLTGREIVRFYGSLRGTSPAIVDEALERTSLNGASLRAVSTYSGGMVQRLGLAVTLVSDAPVLLLDEPTAALDPDGLSAFYAIVDQRRSRGQTILFTSHQMGDIERLADRLAVLIDGRLAATFTAAELAGRRLDSIYRELVSQRSAA